MERLDSMRKGKRKAEEEEQRPKWNRRDLASCSTKQMPDQPQLRLRFKSRLSLPLFTGKKVEGEQGAAIHVELFDATTGHIVTSGPESSAKLEAVLLDGDFDNDDDEDWTQVEFERHLLKERKGKAPLLRGDLLLKLKKGVGTLGSLSITDNSHWIPSGKFRIGLKVGAGHCEGIRIQEAKTEAFAVKDRRGQSYKKHYPPALDDEVWRLDKIRKDGPFYNSLKDNGIITVRHFLRHLARDPKKLREILGSSMQEKSWEVLLKHARTTPILDEKLHIYHLNDSRTLGLIFDDVCELKGLVEDSNYYPADSPHCNLKVSMDDLVKKAHDDWEHIMEYDGNAILNFKQNTLESEMTHDDTFNLEESTPCLPIPIMLEQPTVEEGLLPTDTSYNENPKARYLMHAQPNCFQLGGTSSPLQNQPIGTSHQTQISTNDRKGKLARSSSDLSVSALNEFVSSVFNDSASYDVGFGKLGFDLGSPLNPDHKFASNNMREVPIEHAKTCFSSGKLYIYHPDDLRNVGVVFNNMSGLIAGGHYYPADSLSESQKVYANRLMEEACENWMNVIEYDGKALLNFEQNKRPSALRSEVLMSTSEYQPVFDQQVSLPRLTVSIPPEQQTMESGLPPGGMVYNENQGARYSMQSQNVNTNVHIQYHGSSFTPQNQLIGTSQQTQVMRNDNLVGLAPGPPHSSTLVFHNGGPSIQSPSLSHDEWPRNNRENRGMDDFFSEDEIRMRSHEMLENEDMQHLLRIFSMGGHGSINVAEDAYPFASDEEDRTRSSREVIRWLKVKAAMRWGIFIKKRAAERRAQLVELDD